MLWFHSQAASSNNQRRRQRYDSSSDDDDKESDTEQRDRTQYDSYSSSNDNINIEKQKQIEKKEQERKLQQGLVQRKLKENASKHENTISSQQIGGKVTDNDEYSKSIIRHGDPMAYLEYQKQQKSNTSTNASSSLNNKIKPTYKGPASRPNRYNIKPGYRWDGIDRSTNNFEEKVFKRIYEGKRIHDDSYRARTLDM